MKFVTYIQDGEKPGVLTSDAKSVLSLNEVLSTSYCSLQAFIDDHTQQQMEALKKATETQSGIPLSEVRLTAPIPKSKHDVVCVGVNYVSHLEETMKHFNDGHFEAPQKTVYFGKRAIRITGPDEPIQNHLDIDYSMDYEVELAVVIGSTINSEVEYNDIEKHIFGYSVYNDISSRVIQAKRNQWYYGKSMDTYSVMGPWIVSADEIGITEPLTVESRVNGEVRQHSNTELMRMNVNDLLYELTRAVTLEAGDILATGTPSGIGQGFNPPKFLKVGDVVEVEVEKIGTLRNTII